MKRFFPGMARVRPQSARNNRRPGQSLRFESLESRRLLAVAAFETELLRDDNGVPGEIIADNTLTAGETFFLRITAEEFDTFRSGIRAAAVNVDWDSGLLNVVEEDFDLREVLTEDFPLFQYAQLKNETGSLHDLSGGAMLSWQAGRAIGDGTPETFAIIKMQAGTDTGTASIELSKSRVKTTMVPTVVLGEQHIRFDNETITIVPAPQPVGSETVPPTDSAPMIPATAPAVVPVTESEAISERLPVIEPEPEPEATTKLEADVEPSPQLIESNAAVDQIMSFDMNQDGVFDLGDFGLLNVGTSMVRSIEIPEVESVRSAASPSESETSTPNNSTSPTPFHTCLAFPESIDAAATETWLDAFASAWIADADARQRRREQAELF